jgi:hypothetical protein
MGMKYCDKCEESVDQVVLICPSCGHEEFVPGTVIWAREKKKPKVSKDTTPTTPHYVAGVSETNQPTRMQPSPKPTPRPIPNVGGEFSKTGKTIDDLIRAQNKTTHAVRAFVRFLFIQLTGITFAVFLWNLSLSFIDEQSCYQTGDNCTGNALLQFSAGIVWLIAVILSSRAGWDELNKSNVE